MFLAKVAGIAILIWFYQSAKKNNENGINWAIIGLIGFWLVWWIVTLTVANPWLDSFTKGGPVVLLLLIRQLPAIAGIVVAFFIRKKLIASADNSLED